MPGRQIVGGELYRYAFQGQEKDPETGKEAFQLRLWDGRIGRWLTTDPKHDGVSPYWGMNNNPIRIIDPDGGSGDDIIYLDSNGNEINRIKMDGPNIYLQETYSGGIQKGINVGIFERINLPNQIDFSKPTEILSNTFDWFKFVNNNRNFNVYSEDMINYKTLPRPTSQDISFGSMLGLRKLDRGYTYGENGFIRLYFIDGGDGKRTNEFKAVDVQRTFDPVAEKSNIFRYRMMSEAINGRPNGVAIMSIIIEGHEAHHFVKNKIGF